MRPFWRAPYPPNTPPWDTLIADASLLAVDIETTGLDPVKNRIVSVGWVPITQRVIELGEAVHYIVSGGPVEQSATVHGITDDDVAAGSAAEEVFEHLSAALEGRMMLAHYSDIERNFLARWHKDFKGSRVEYPAVDTFAIERRHMERMGTYPRGEDLRLSRVRARYGLPSYRSHHALGDALACAELFLAQTAHGKARKLKDLRY